MPFDPGPAPFDPPYDPVGGGFPPLDNYTPPEPPDPYSPPEPPLDNYTPPEPPDPYSPPEPPLDNYTPPEPPDPYSPPEPPLDNYTPPEPPDAYTPPEPPGDVTTPDLLAASATSNAIGGLLLNFGIDESAVAPAPEAIATKDGSLVVGPFPPSDTTRTYQVDKPGGGPVTVTVAPHDYASYEIVDGPAQQGVIPPSEQQSTGAALLSDLKTMWTVVAAPGPTTPAWLDFSRFFEVGPARAGAIDAVLGLGNKPPTDPADRAEWDRGQNTIAVLSVLAAIAGELPTGSGPPPGGGFGPEPVVAGGGPALAVPAQVPAAAAVPGLLATGSDPAANGKAPEPPAAGGSASERPDPPATLPELENRIFELKDPQLDQALRSVDPNDPAQVRALEVAVEIRESSPAYGTGPEPGASTRDTPGASQPAPFEAGNFAHKYAEALVNSCTTYDVPQQFRADVESGRIISLDQLPSTGLKSEVSIGVTARVDRVGGVLYEIKPNTEGSIAAGLKQLDAYVKLANDTNFGGRNDWTGKVVVYDAAQVRKFIP